MSAAGASPDAGAIDADPYRVFRPRRGARMARAAAAAVVVFFGIVALSMPRLEISGTQLIDRVLMMAFGLAVAAFIYRYAQLRAVPDTEGITIRNLIRTERLSWPQIFGVGFSGGTPWALIELTDTEEISVMAIQRADGEHGRAEAARLAALVAHHSSTEQT